LELKEESKMKVWPKEVLKNWERYQLGIPDFVPAYKRELVGKCNNAICRVLNNTKPLRVLYNPFHGTTVNWLTVLRLAVELGYVTKDELDQVYVMAKANDYLPEVEK
jgi:hypothetical protein